MSLVHLDACQYKPCTIVQGQVQGSFGGGGGLCGYALDLVSRGWVYVSHACRRSASRGILVSRTVVRWDNLPKVTLNE